jgi:hypothetical protein
VVPEVVVVVALARSKTIVSNTLFEWLCAIEVKAPNKNKKDKIRFIVFVFRSVFLKERKP